MSNDKRLEQIKNAAISIASTIQDHFDDSKDSQDLYESIDSDLELLKKAFNNFEDNIESFLNGK